VIGVAVTFHYINRMVNVFLCESPLPPVPAVALKGVRFAATRVLSNLARIRPRPAQSLELLPDAPLPAELSWAGGQPHIGAAFARAGAAIDAGGTRSVPDRVRQLVTTVLDAGTGAPGLASGAWLEPAVTDLPAQERPAARLALLTALGSYRVTDPVVNDFLAGGGDDRALIELTAWASMAAARRIGQQLREDVTTGPGDA
jgi:hypothetical protein